MSRPTEWILVLSATRARLLRGLPAPGEPARPELVLRAPSHKLRDIMSDKPGRSFSSGSKRMRSAMEYGSDPLRQDEIEFLRQVIALVEAHLHAGEFERLVVVSAPRTLGLWREELPGSLRHIISGEIAKNFAGIDESALPAMLRTELGWD